MFIPNFPAVPSSKQLYDLLLQKYPEGSGSRIVFTNLHLRTYESKYSMKDTVEFLNNQLYQPRKDLPPLLLRLPIQWDMDPYQDRNWCLHLNSLRSMDRFFINYEKKTDIEFLETPYKLISDYALFHFRILGRVKKHYFLLDDMTCGIRQSRISYLLDKYMSNKYLINDDVELKKISYLIHFQWKVLSDTANFKSTNHTISLLHAIMSLVQIFDVDNKQLWEKEVCRCLDHLIQSQFDKYGVHTENSPEYHFFALKLFKELIKSNWYDELSDSTIETLKNAEIMGEWMRYPDGRVLPIGDSTGKIPPDVTSLELGHGKNEIDWSLGLECLLHPMYVVLKKIYGDSWTFFAMKSGHMIETHRHRDDLSFIWSENGIDLVIDPGKYAYTKDIYRSFIKSQQAHNTISFSRIVKGKKRFFDFEPDDTLPSCHKVSFGQHLRHFKRVIGTDILFIRNIYFKPKCWVIIIDKILGSDEDVLFSNNVHFSPEFVWDYENNLLLKDKDVLDVNFISNEPLIVNVSSGGDLGNEMNGFISREYRKVQPCPYIQLSGSGDVTLAVTLNISKEPLELELDENGCFTLLYSGEKVVLEKD